MDLIDLQIIIFIVLICISFLIILYLIIEQIVIGLISDCFSYIIKSYSDLSESDLIRYKTIYSKLKSLGLNYDAVWHNRFDKDLYKILCFISRNKEVPYNLIVNLRRKKWYNKREFS